MQVNQTNLNKGDVNNVSGQAAQPKTPEQMAGEVATLMNIVINVVSPSDISSHVKGDVIRLLQRLRDEEVLRLLKCGKEWGK